MRTRIRLALLTAATVTMAASLTSVARDTPTTVPTTSHSGNWFGSGKNAPPSLDQMSEAALFAQMYPELARMDKGVRAATPRVLFDAMLCLDKPPQKMPGCLTVGSVFTALSDRRFSASNPPDPFVQVFDERRARIRAVDARRMNASLFLDVETLPLDTRFASGADVDHSVRLIAEEVGWIRAQDPNLRLFFYNGFPASDDHLGINRARSATTKPGTEMYQWWKDSAAGFDKQREARRAASERLMRPPEAVVGVASPALAELFDATCPSLYLYSESDFSCPGDIEGFAREYINESRRYAKPVYPFVWYQQPKDSKYVPLKMWTLLLREVLTYADGAILWDGPTKWNARKALRVRLATLLASKQGAMTDADLYDAVKADYPNDPEVSVLRGDGPTTQQSP